MICPGSHLVCVSITFLVTDKEFDVKHPIGSYAAPSQIDSITASPFIKVHF